MGTTTTGLPYPEPTDPIAAGADAIRELAEAVETTVLRSSRTTVDHPDTGPHPPGAGFIAKPGTPTLTHAGAPAINAAGQFTATGWHHIDYVAVGTTTGLGMITQRMLVAGAQTNYGGGCNTDGITAFNTRTSELVHANAGDPLVTQFAWTCAGAHNLTIRTIVIVTFVRT